MMNEAHRALRNSFINVVLVGFGLLMVTTVRDVTRQSEFR
jgi:hypothetical protein